MHRLIICLTVVLIACFAHATVEPALDALVSSSSLILTGSVSRVRSTGSDSSIVTITPETILKGEVVTQGALSFQYTRVGKGNIDFTLLREKGVTQIFFLRQSTSGLNAFELTDAWFGVEEVTQATLSEIKRLAKADG